MISRLISTRFELLERVGDGAIFQVQKARDKSNSRIVAIKTLQTAFERDSALAEALRAEMPGFTTLSHPNISRLEEVGEEDGQPFLVTEYIRGINLKERIRRIAPFTLSVAVDFAITIAEALQHAHAQGAVHGDLRSQNVIVSPEGVVKVTDFGMPRALAASPAASAANLVRSAAYQSPEAAQGRAPSVGDDLYSLGVILFEMLTGSLPFTGDNPAAIASRRMSGPPPSPREINPGVPRSVEGIVMMALAVRQEERYRSAADVLNDLKSVRDALRFGKPLSWSPQEIDRSGASPLRDPQRVAAIPLAVPLTGPPASVSASALDSPGETHMSTTTRPDDRISPFLKAALYSVVFVLIAAGIGLTAFWMAITAKLPEQKAPEFKGMKIEDARRTADAANVRLLVHEEYNDKVPAGTVFQIDAQAQGRPLRPGRSINVWVSRGSKLVYVPDLVNLDKDEAEAKLKEAGLTLGTVNRENDKKIPLDHIISQNPRAKKRVNRDLAVALTVSDGPKADEGSPPDTPTETGDGSTNPFNNPSPSTSGGQPPVESGGAGGASGAQPGGGTGLEDRAGEVHSANLKKRIPHDGLGSRRVRIEYDDARGTHTPVDEVHEEGDNVPVRVDSYGPTITVRVYYGDDPKPVSERTFTFPKPKEQ